MNLREEELEDTFGPCTDKVFNKSPRIVLAKTRNCCCYRGIGPDRVEAPPPLYCVVEASDRTKGVAIRDIWRKLQAWEIDECAHMFLEACTHKGSNMYELYFGS